MGLYFYWGGIKFLMQMDGHFEGLFWLVNNFMIPFIRLQFS